MWTAVLWYLTIAMAGAKTFWHPVVPDVEGLKETGYWTNEDVFGLLHLPASLIVVGGGPIGVELSQAFERLGAKVTLIQGPDRILPREDPEVSAEVASVLKSEGIDLPFMSIQP